MVFDVEWSDGGVFKFLEIAGLTRANQFQNDSKPIDSSSKQDREISTDTSRVNQKPNLGRRNEKAKNMGNVGRTYQNVNHA